MKLSATNNVTDAYGLRGSLTEEQSKITNIDDILGHARVMKLSFKSQEDLSKID